LPNRPFGAWLSGLVGQGAGVVWQLAECGSGAPGGTGQDAQACAEVTALLPNGDTLIVGISVGTFKKGLIGEPTFMRAVIKSDEQIYQVRRLGDLPGMLRTPSGILRMPDLQANPPQVVMRSFTYPPLVALSADNDNPAPGFLEPDEDKTPPPPPPPQSPQSSGKLVDASVISRAKPTYPAAARNLKVVGKVEVKVVISEAGRVIEATAVSGHMTLHAAATAAARQWVFKPATRDGVPVKTESVLTFTFGDQ
jgi:protein TonB